MKRSAIFKAAARRIAEGTSIYACDALTHVHPDAQPGEWIKFHEDRDLFAEYFEPEEHNGIWWNDAFEYDERKQLARSLALLFMAEIFKEQEE